MATSFNRLPQALHMIARNPTQSSKKLGFSTFLSCAPSMDSSFSKLSLNHSGSKFGFSLDTKVRKEFIVRAEDNAEAEPEEAAVDEIADAEGNVEEVVEVGEAKPMRKPRIKLGDVMGILNKKAIEVSEKVRPVPEIRTGDIVEIKLEVPENRRRLSIYKGIVMSRQNAGIHTTIRIRRIIAGIGVEIVFPIYSPNIKEIKVMSHRKVRRARLYYLRDKLPRLSTFK
ncbi:PREDICTED: 50S ribosomal protein L19-1, chloroplastic-like [Camelina sativa]|uniref:50S ribosomal protein L19-1, chloroplastic-like n=1 Tax=Camelina sativa TaxID=90675 RepID=A0ABM0U1Y9_CAMSA|nr:PREDICTED: 50S ribosomal protein L19-1, chloroplastic-like [Camelina sativa]